MKYKQVVSFNKDRMGTAPNWCLKNVREGFGIPPKYADAKSAMKASANAGTLHDISTLPTDVAVPVFVDTSSIYEHVIVADHGTFYSDGKRLTSLTGLPCFGWSETLNDVRVVEAVPEEEPKPAKEPADDIKEGDKVVPIKLVDYDGRPLRQYDEEYTVKQRLAGSDRIVLEARGAVWAALNVHNVRKVE